MSIMLRVEERAATTRLDVFLAAKTGISRSQVKRLFESGQVFVNKSRERASYIVQAGDAVTFEAAPTISAMAVPAPSLPIVYEDDDVIVVDKPAGIATHMAPSLKPQPTVADFARLRSSDADKQRPGIVHRLDRDTSGLMIIAKSPQVKAFLQAQFKARKVMKTYTLLVVGRLDPPDAQINLPLGRNQHRPLQRAVTSTGKPAVTAYHTVATYPGYSLIEANPKTGRTHQLRVHFAAIGHPIAGDTTYGATKRPLGLTRQFLHASALSFTSPSGKLINVTSPLPDDLTLTLQKRLAKG